MGENNGQALFFLASHRRANYRKAELEFDFVFLGRAPCFEIYVRASKGAMVARIIHN